MFLCRYKKPVQSIIFGMIHKKYSRSAKMGGTAFSLFCFYSLSFAQAQDVTALIGADGLYASGALMGRLPSKEAFTLTGTNFSFPSDSTLNYAPGYGFQTAFGAFYSDFRAEFSFGYERAQIADTNLSVSSPNLPNVNFAFKVDEMNMNIFSAGLNGYYKIPFVYEKIQPYIGVGLGYGLVQPDALKTTFSSQGGAFAASNNISLPSVGIGLFRAIAGISYPVTDRIDLTTEYRFVGTSNLNFKTDMGNLKFDYGGHKFGIGVRYRFGNPSNPTIQQTQRKKIGPIIEDLPPRAPTQKTAFPRKITPIQQPAPVPSQNTLSSQTAPISVPKYTPTELTPAQRVRLAQIPKPTAPRTSVPMPSYHSPNGSMQIQRTSAPGRRRIPIPVSAPPGPSKKLRGPYSVFLGRFGSRAAALNYAAQLRTLPGYYSQLDRMGLAVAPDPNAAGPHPSFAIPHLLFADGFEAKIARDFCLGLFVMRIDCTISPVSSAS